MIVVKKWSALKRRGRQGWVRYIYTGWFLFGIVPLVIAREGVAR